MAKAGEVIPTLGYDERVTGDMQASLTTRLESLRTGGKGAMLDVARSLPISDLLGQPTVIELEAMGDDGDKAFLAALILVRLAEHRRSQGQTDELVHLLVVEEAHRLLGNVPARTSEEADPRGQAVETFSNLLSEVRAYGQGVIIADQVPVRLAPDVVKNTTLKIAHRTVSADDRATLGGAMAMVDAQTRALTTLEIGEAAVFSAGDDSPLLIRVPLGKDPLSPRPPSDDVVAEHMTRWQQTSAFQEMFLPRAFCVETCSGKPAACEAARRLAADGYFQRALSRVVLSTIEAPGALSRSWEDLAIVVRARRPVRVAEVDLMRALAGHGSDWLAHRRGAQGAWSYADTARFRNALRAVLLAKVEGEVPDQLLTAFSATAHQLHMRDSEPYPACHIICTHTPAVCLYRSAVADLLLTRRHHGAWRAADDFDARSEDKRRRQTWDVCQDAAYELVEFPDAETSVEVNTDIELAARRVCMCFGQQMLAEDHTKVPRTSRRILARLIAESGL